MPGHPNATAAAFSSGLGAFVSWLLGRYGVHVGAAAGAGIAGGIATIVLFVGRRGLRGALQTLWSGSPKPPAGPPPSALP